MTNTGSIKNRVDYRPVLSKIKLFWKQVWKKTLCVQVCQIKVLKNTKWKLKRKVKIFDSILV